MNGTEIFFNNHSLVEESLSYVRHNYRPLDPGWYLYRKLLKYNLSDKFSTDFIELIYVTLSAWNMNSRGAKLQEFDLFEESILNHKKTLMQLGQEELKNIGNKSVKDALKDLFAHLNLVAHGKPKLVTYSKTFHFFLPDLIVPIDRKYTLCFFYGNIYVPQSIEKQFDRFIEIENEFCRLHNNVDFRKYIDDNWNLNIPKILDNLIIGYRKL